MKIENLKIYFILDYKRNDSIRIVMTKNINEMTET